MKSPKDSNEADKNQNGKTTIRNHEEPPEGNLKDSSDSRRRDVPVVTERFFGEASSALKSQCAVTSCVSAGCGERRLPN